MMLATSAAVPFIGFGFMDNAIMIVAGEVRLPSCFCFSRRRIHSCTPILSSLPEMQTRL